MNSELSMDQVLIEKLTKLLEVNLDKEHFGVKELAKEAGLSRSQLHRKLKSIEGKSASKFIREFRLNKAMVMLQNNVATASEIAYCVGFSSPTYFNTCFHDHYGYPPGEVKFRNTSTNQDNESIQKAEQKDYNQDPSTISLIKKISFRQRLIMLSSLGLLIIIAFSYFLYFGSHSVTGKEIASITPVEKSIAIIPFKNLSKEKEDEFFTLGVTTSLQNQLNTIKGLKVISENSMEKYADTIIAPSEIAKEIDVTYLLDGTIQKHKDSIRVIIHFINAKDDHQLISLIFDEEFNNLFALQSNIAKQVAEELNIKLSESELKKFSKNPTDNLEAYNLYLKGRFFWHRRTKEDLNKSIEYFEKALDIDSNYALAYAGLADSYYIMAWWGWFPKKEGFIKGKELVKKALTIDNNIAEAHTTLGGILTFHDWNWKEAEKELKLAISLNPNYDNAHHYYYELLDILRRNEEARIQMNLALELNPYSLILNRQSSYTYYNIEDYTKAIEGFRKAIELEIGNDMLVYADKLAIIKCYFILGHNELAVEVIKEIISSNPSLDTKVVDEVYLKLGMDGLMNWFIDWILENKSIENFHDIMNIAPLYSIIGDSENALKFLEKGVKEGNLGLPFINNNPDFNSIRADSRFKAILKKMNLGDY